MDSSSMYYKNPGILPNPYALPPPSAFYGPAAVPLRQTYGPREGAYAYASPARPGPTVFGAPPPAAVLELWHLGDPHLRVSAGPQARGWDIRELYATKLIDQGALGALYRGVWHGVPVSIKQVRGTELGTAIDAYLHESHLLADVAHPHLVAEMAAIRTSDGYFIVEEFVSDKTLHALIHRDTNFRSLSLRRVLRYGQQIAAVLDYLHRRKIVHRDLKPANLLLDSGDMLKLADFDLSLVAQRLNLSSLSDSWRWMAPEAIMNHPYNEKVDIYSFAILMWEMIATEIPYNDRDEVTAAKTTAYGYRPHRPVREIPEALWELIERCWQQSPEARPTAWEIGHWLKDIEVQYLADEAKKSRRGCSLA